jgi:hypothetical protein
MKLPYRTLPSHFIMPFDFSRRFLYVTAYNNVAGGHLVGEISTTMDKLGYIISEAPVFFLVIWLAVRLVQYRRRRNKQPLFSERDKALLFPPKKIDLRSPVLRVRFARCILLATAATYFEFLMLAPLGAAILCIALMLTTAGIVHGILFDPA